MFGWLAFRLRDRRLPVDATQAMTYTHCCAAFFRNEMGFGGNNGLTDFVKDIIGNFSLTDGAPRAGVIPRYGGCHYLVRDTGLPRDCRWFETGACCEWRSAMREMRTRFMGYRVECLQTRRSSCSPRHKLAGAAGALYVPMSALSIRASFLR